MNKEILQYISAEIINDVPISLMISSAFQGHQGREHVGKIDCQTAVPRT